MSEEKEKQFFTPAEAASYLSRLVGKTITVSRVAQFRRAGDVEAMQMGYNVTVYRREKLDELARRLQAKQRGRDNAA